MLELLSSSFAYERLDDDMTALHCFRETRKLPLLSFRKYQHGIALCIEFP